jgi:predicted alpha/beta superfamily hydrolase
LQSKYKISKKVLWGKGFSGMFSTFVMLSKPDLFDGYIADGPKLDLLEKSIISDSIFEKISETNVFYHLAGSSTEEKDKLATIFLNKLKHEQMNNFKWNYSEQNDSIFIARILTTYIYGLDSFFKEMNE